MLQDARWALGRRSDVESGLQQRWPAWQAGHLFQHMICKTTYCIYILYKYSQIYVDVRAI